MSAGTLLPAEALPDQPAVIRNTFGEVGLLEMPTSRMAPDGQLAFVFGDVGQQQHFVLSFQALPWLDASFRYSHVVGPFSGYYNRHYYDRSFGVKARLFREGSVMPEVSVGVRDILGTGIYASEYLVANKRFGAFDLSAGMGWGELAQNGTIPNPFGLISNTMKVRKAHNSVTGVVDVGQFFRGEKAGIFGGIAWQTPIDDLQVLVEYSSDRYKGYVYPGGLRVRSPVNVGLSYQPFTALAVTAGWMYGTTYGLTINLRGDPTTSYPSAVRIGPEVPPPALRSDDQKSRAIANLGQGTKDTYQARAAGIWVKVASPAEAARQNLLQAFMSEARGVRDVEVLGKSVVVDARLRGDPDRQCAEYSRIAVSSAQEDITSVALTDLQNPNGAVIFCAANGLPANARSPRPPVTAKTDGTLQSRIAKDIRSQDLMLSGLWVQGSEIWVYFENYRYRNTTEAVGRIARILMTDAPPTIEIFHLIPSVLGMPQQEVTISRSGLERALASYTSVAVLGDTIGVSAPPARNPGLDAFVGERYPQLTYAIDPKLTQHVFDPDHPIQFMVYADAPILLQLLPGLNINAHFTAQIWSNYTYARAAESALPHVRSDVLRYLNQGKYGISALDISYTTKLAPEVFAQVRAGYLEDMYFGAGSQVLWRPEQSRFAFGADFYQVWQRNYNRLFGLQSYKVFTGHVSAYYRSSWHDLNYAIHAGRYLAGDYGATFEITRRFESGVEIGAWATFTDVPFNKFGEGSFDKGIIIHIPFEWGLPIWSQSSYDLRLNSLTRDGGQRLAGDDSLYRFTSGTSYGEITDHLGNITNP